MCNLSGLEINYFVKKAKFHLLEGKKGCKNESYWLKTKKPICKCVSAVIGEKIILFKQVKPSGRKYESSVVSVFVVKAKSY